jgi:hypothetical protein
VGDLPGYTPGLYTHKNRTFLIINGPELIEPAPGSCEIILLTEAWDGREEELDNLLAENARYTNQTQDLSKIKWKSGAIGEGLAQLEKVRPDRVTKRPRKHGGERGWIIQPPEGHVEYIKEKAEEQKAKQRIKTGC